MEGRQNPIDSAESFSMYRSELLEALLLAEYCFVGLDATTFIGFKPDQLSQMDKLNSDNEYARWIQNELRTGAAPEGKTKGAAPEGETPRVCAKGP